MNTFHSSLDPSQYGLAADFIYIEKEWGSLFYKHIGEKSRIEAKQLCAQEGENVHLPIPRSDKENEFYRVYFGERNLWLGIIDDSNGLATDGFKWGSTTPNERQTIYVSRRNKEQKSQILYDWLKFKDSIENNESFVKGIQLTRSGRWQSLEETANVNSVCIFNVIPNECSKCRDEYFCHYSNKKQQTKCICKFDVEDPQVISSVIEEGQQYTQDIQDAKEYVKLFQFQISHGLSIPSIFSTIGAPRGRREISRDFAETQVANWDQITGDFAEKLNQLDGYRRFNC